MTADLMVSIFFLNANDSSYILINVVNNLSRWQRKNRLFNFLRQIYQNE